jgi:hypothetical protein
LTPEEIFELGERAVQEGHGVPVRPFSSVDTDLSTYRAVVERVTGVLAEHLPGFEEWLELYRADPAVVEERLLGFWKERPE